MESFETAVSHAGRRAGQLFCGLAPGYSPRNSLRCVVAFLGAHCKRGECFRETRRIETYGDLAELPILVAVRGPVSDDVLRPQICSEFFAGEVASEDCAPRHLREAVQWVNKRIGAGAVDSNVLLQKRFLDLPQRITAVIFQPITQDKQRLAVMRSLLHLCNSHVDGIPQRGSPTRCGKDDPFLDSGWIICKVSGDLSRIGEFDEKVFVVPEPILQTAVRRQPGVNDSGAGILVRFTHAPAAVEDDPEADGCVID